MENQYWIKKPVTLLHTNTGNRMKSSEKTLEKLDQVLSCHNSGLPRKKHWNSQALVSKAILPEKPMFYIKKAFLNLPKAIELVNTTPEKYSKKVFPCCWYLKHKVFEYWIKQTGDHENDVFISGIRRGDGFQRRMFLLRMRRKGTHFLKHKRINAWYYYPLRDVFVSEIDSYFKDNLEWLELTSSGCRVCPILVLFEIKSAGDRYNRSLKVWENLQKKNKPELQSGNSNFPSGKE